MAVRVGTQVACRVYESHETGVPVRRRHRTVACIARLDVMKLFSNIVSLVFKLTAGTAWAMAPGLPWALRPRPLPAPPGRRLPPGGGGR